ncbi:MAG: rod-binding protein [bacterium]
MEINSDFVQQKVQMNLDLADDKNVNSKLNNINENNSEKNNKKLKKVVNEFSSIFIKKMFESMRNTLPEEKLIDGGYAEDVFTDMLDKEISQLGSEQNNFDNLNKQLYEQLLRKQQSID